MKRLVLTAAMMIALVITAVSQEKGAYLTVGGSLGSSAFMYKMDNNRYSTPQLGYGGQLGFQYYFSRHWGLGTGVGISYYNTLGKYNNSFDNGQYGEYNNDYIFTNQWDKDSRWPNDSRHHYDLQLRLNDWHEYQEAYFLEIPLMLMYQTKWGEKQRHGMYWGVGAKAQIPVFGQQYKLDDQAKLTMLGYYPLWDLTLGEPQSLPHHSFGTNTQVSDLEQYHKNENLNIKTSFAATAELGFLIGLSRRVDLTLGAYLDYGFNDIKDGDNLADGYLIRPKDGVSQQDGKAIGEMLDYAGLINSKAVDKVNLLSFGGKVGLRIKLGKLKEEEVKENQQEELIVVEEIKQAPKPEPEPVVTVQPVVVEEKGVSDAEIAILSEPIFFDLAKSDLKPASIDVLNRKVTILNKYPNVKLLILGNTCDLGGDRINIPLGQRRADAARDYLEKNGISRSRMSTVTQASSHPIVPNTNEENRSKNRRDDFEPNGY